ncbi:hypothetical protein GGR52DRAFT_532801 [Hypoxylon sp. FL1284]|nr:hypothetical protein GGR52DRAFT_532801 [Hypoxylon sp. FL1284]
MARTTRSKANASAETTDSKSKPASSNSQSRYTLPTASTKPPIIFVLPKKATRDARIVSLFNPRYQAPTRYLVCPETGIYEFTTIAAPKTTPRSWFIERDGGGDTDKTQPKTGDDGTEFRAYVASGAELHVATPLDPVFLLLAAFADQSGSTRGGKRMLVTMDDHLDSVRDQAPHLSEIVRWGGGRTRALLEARMAAVCETAQAGDDNVFRFSENKMAAEMLAKARAMCAHGLPRSLEDRYVTKKLEAPIVGVKREAVVSSTAPEQAQVETPMSASGVSTPKIESADSQSSESSAATTATLASEASTAATSVTAEPELQLQPALRASEDVVQLMRLRGALQFLSARYLSREHSAELFARLGSGGLVDFTPLDAYLYQLATVRQEAAAARSATDYSRKRGLDDVDDEVAAERAEKKRRKEEAEKRKKAGESKAVRDLKKVSTTGMKKMSDFFKKK